jgi:hypothetical protein
MKYAVEYDRLNPPTEVDKSEFSEVCEVARLSGTQSSKELTGKQKRMLDFTCPASTVYGYAEFPKHLTKCVTRYYSAYSKEVNALAFMPDHGVMVARGDRRILVEESLWHGRLFFTESFRNDHTTAWKWLTKKAYTPDVVVTEPTNYCYHVFNTSYFHWFMDVLPHVWYLKQHSPYKKGRKWFCGKIDTPYKIESLKAFGIDTEDLVPACDGVIEFKNLALAGFTFEEPIFTRPSFHNGIHHVGWSRAYTHDVRKALLSHFGIHDPKREKRYYLSRSDAWHRKVTNEAEVIEVLGAAGFETIVPGELSFEDQVRTFSKADIVIGAHGAGFTNILWAPSGVRLVELMPERLADVGYRFISNMLDQKHIVVSCKQGEHRFGDAFSDLEVDLDLLKKVLADVL